MPYKALGSLELACLLCVGSQKTSTRDVYEALRKHTNHPLPTPGALNRTLMRLVDKGLLNSAANDTDSEYMWRRTRDGAKEARRSIDGLVKLSAA